MKLAVLTSGPPGSKVENTCSRRGGVIGYQTLEHWLGSNSKLIRGGTHGRPVAMASISATSTPLAKLDITNAIALPAEPTQFVMVLIRWRSDFKTDGVTCFSDVAGGLDQITIRRFEGCNACTIGRPASLLLLSCAANWFLDSSRSRLSLPVSPEA